MRRNAKISFAIAAVASFFTFAGQAFAAPVVTIDPNPTPSFTGISGSGTIDPGDQEVSVYAEYATDPGGPWGERFEQTIPADSGPTPISYEITGLTPGTQYYVRLNAWTGTYNLSSEVSATTLAVDPPSVVISSVSAVTGSGAHFSGTINPSAPAGDPAAFDVAWSFQCTPVCPGLAGGTIPADSATHTIEADATGLKPGTTYEVTLTGTNAGGTASAEPEAFTTATIAPQALSVKAQPRSTEATLSAEIQPGGLATTYHFEYGPTAAYGNSTPVRTIAPGGDPVAVRANVFGLASGGSYHYRVVAANDDGTVQGGDAQFTTAAAGGTDSCPNAAVRAQQGSAFLPECRAYELVNPAEKGGGTIAFGAATAGVGLNMWNGVTASLDGERLAYGAWIRLANGKSGMPLTYRAERGADGWSSEAVSPNPRRPQAQFHVDFAGWEAVTPDLEIGYGDLSRDSFDPTDVNDEVDIYRTGPNEETELISRGNGAERLGPEQGAREAIIGISKDGRQLFFASAAHLVPEDAGRVDEFGLFDVYVRSQGQTSIVNQSNSGELINRCGSQLGSSTSDEGAISADGTSVFFQVPYNTGFSGSPDCSKPAQIYMRVDNAETVHISASQRTEPDPAGEQEATFQAATRDGEIVFFSSNEMLTDEATPGGGLYRYEVDSGDLELIIPFETASGESIWPDTVRVSADGSRVYFLSYFELAEGAVYANRNLFVWSEDEGFEFVGTSESFEFGELLLGRPYKAHASERTMILTPDGEDALFVTKAPLTDFESKGRKQVYHYDGSAKKLTCISCDPAGQRPAGSVVRSDASYTGDAERDTPISADGDVAVFQSGDRLVPQDLNNRIDVYQYSDGKLSLITPGREDVDSYLVGMGPSGKNVFVATFASLVGADRDGGDLDIYVARTDGGFLEAERPASPSPCEGEGCQGPLAAAPAQARPSSASVSGPGNANQRKRGLKPCQRAKGKKSKRSMRKTTRAKAKGCRKAGVPSNNARKGR